MLRELYIANGGEELNLPNGKGAGLQLDTNPMPAIRFAPMNGITREQHKVC